MIYNRQEDPRSGGIPKDASKGGPAGSPSNHAAGYWT